MKRFLITAVTIGFLSLGISATTAEAGDVIHQYDHHGPAYAHGIVGSHRFLGGHHAYRGIGVYGGHGVIGHGTHYPYYRSGYRGYLPGHHLPDYRPYRPIHRGHGGVHLDVGPLHLGIGGHH